MKRTRRSKRILAKLLSFAVVLALLAPVWLAAYADDLAEGGGEATTQDGALGRVEPPDTTGNPPPLEVITVPDPNAPSNSENEITDAQQSPIAPMAWVNDGIVASATYIRNGVTEELFKEDYSSGFYNDTHNTIIVYPLGSTGYMYTITLINGYTFDSTSTNVFTFTATGTQTENVNITGSGGTAGSITSEPYKIMVHPTTKLSINVGANGSIVVDPNTTKPGNIPAGTQTSGITDVGLTQIQVNPSSGYELDQITLKDEGGATVPIDSANSNVANNLYGYNLQSAAYELTVTFVAEPTTPTSGMIATYNGTRIYVQEKSEPQNEDYTISAPVKTIYDGNGKIILMFAGDVTHVDDTVSGKVTASPSGSTAATNRVEITLNTDSFTDWDTADLEVTYSNNSKETVSIYGSAMIRNTITPNNGGKIVYSYSNRTKDPDTITSNITNYLDPGPATISATVTPNSNYTFSSYTFSKVGGSNQVTGSSPYNLGALDPVIYEATATFKADTDPDPDPKTYKITVDYDTTRGSSATANLSSAKEGESISLTATARNGYRFKEWQVVDGVITLSPRATANPATFVMPASDVTVRAVFESTGSGGSSGSGSSGRGGGGSGGSGGRTYTGTDRTSLDQNSSKVAASGDYTWRVDLPLLGFFNAYVDGELFERGVDYTVREGSTILTLTSAGLSRAGRGDHRLRMEFVATDVYFDFTVANTTNVGSGGGNTGPEPTDPITVPGTTTGNNQNPGTGLHSVLWNLLNLNFTLSFVRVAGLLLTSLLVTVGLWGLLPRRGVLAKRG